MKLMNISVHVFNGTYSLEAHVLLIRGKGEEGNHNNDDDDNGHLLKHYSVPRMTVSIEAKAP